MTFRDPSDLVREAELDKVLGRAPDADWIRAVHKEHVITSWSAQQDVHPSVIAGADGCWFWDADGNRYLDFESQLVNLNLGHQHPRLVEAIVSQARALSYAGPAMANEAKSRLAAAIAAITPGTLNRSFFTSGGAEATENAMRLARHVTGRSKIVARYRSYHGATAGALSTSGDPRRWGTEPGVPGVVRIFDPYTYRCPAGHPDPCPVCTGGPHLEEVLAYENPDTVAAVILETVTGTNGILVPPDGYLQAIREVTSRHGILLILDEVMVGFGRTGRWFAFQHWGIEPDILCVGKGINSGYVPLGAMVVTEAIGEWLDTHSFPGGLTYSGHPLACSSGAASLQIMLDEGVVENAVHQGDKLMTGLRNLEERHPSIGEVRGLGLFMGIELVRDRETREPLVPFNAKRAAAAPMKAVLADAKARGLYLSAYSNVIRIAPPLIIGDADRELGLAILDEALNVADEYVNA